MTLSRELISVGKTSLINRFATDKYSCEYKPTIGADFTSKDVTLDNGTSITLQIWDTAGCEKYHSLGIAFYKGSECCGLVFDITNPKSFETVTNWKDEFLM